MTEDDGAVEQQAASDVYTATAPEQRPAMWAQRVVSPTISNLHEVAPGVYRSGKLTVGAGGDLVQLGVETVINLCPGRGDGLLLAGTGIREIRLPLSSRKVSNEDLDRFMVSLIDASRQGGVLFHCSAGADRSGVMAAAYRVAVDQWPPEEAVREMRQGGYGFHARYTNLPALVVAWSRQRG